MVANFSATILVYPFTRQMCSPLSKFRYSTIVQADQKNKETPDFKGFLKKIERVMGIEPTYPAWKAGVLPLNYTRISVGVTGFEPATSWSQTRRSSQAEPHPEGFVCVLSVTQELVYSKGKNMSTTFFIFFYIFLKWLPDSLKELPGRHFIRIRCAIQRLYSRSPSQASLSWREEPCLDGLWHSSAGE